MLRLEGITKTFNKGTPNAKVALDNLSLTLERGDFVTVVGSNGSGKSSLFSTIAGSFFVDAGSIYLEENDITFLPEHKRSRSIGRLFQNPLLGTAPGMTIEENLALVALSAPKERRFALSGINKTDKAFLRERLVTLNMGLEDRMNQPVGLLSGGQRQALTMLMATLVTPKLLLLDEHTAALDPKAAANILDLTAKIVESSKITCLMVTHNMKQALDMGNRTIMMDGGTIVFDVKDPLRKSLTAEDLLTRFRQSTGKPLDNDRVLLSRADFSS